MDSGNSDRWGNLVDTYTTKGYVIQMEETIVSVVPESKFDWDFVIKYRGKILAEKIKLPNEDITDFRIRMHEVAEKIRHQREMRN